MHLPFLNKYPYTNFEQLNLDWLLNMVGGFDARITKNTNDIATLRTDLDNEVTRSTEKDSEHDNKISAIESDIDDLDTRLEDEIDRSTNIDADHETRINDLESDVDDLETEFSIVKHELDDLESVVEDIPEVEANPGGSGTNLNTIKIGDTVYNIVGSGQGGSSITPNPSGTATEDLNKVDIDGTIYDIPSGSEVVINPSGTSSGTATKISVDGTIYDIQGGSSITIDSVLDPTSHNAIENSPVATSINNINSDISSIESDITDMKGDISDNASDISDILDSLNILGQVTTHEVLLDVSNTTDSGITLSAGTYILCGEILSNGLISASSQVAYWELLSLSDMSSYPYVNYYYSYEYREVKPTDSQTSSYRMSDMGHGFCDVLVTNEPVTLSFRRSQTTVLGSTIGSATCKLRAIKLK